MKSDLSQGCDGLMYVASEFGDYFCVEKRNRGEPVEVVPGVFSNSLVFRKDRMNIAEFTAESPIEAVKSALRDRAHMVVQREHSMSKFPIPFYMVRLLDAEDLNLLRAKGITYYEQVVQREKLIVFARNGRCLFPGG
jgi:hypothetical protein